MGDMLGKNCFTCSEDILLTRKYHVRTDVDNNDNADDDTDAIASGSQINMSHLTSAGGI